jgi:glycosyltransferase involved in cell wall biosynthesis
MKIIHIIPNLKKGGAERIVIDIVRTLNKHTSNQVKLILFEKQIEYDVDDILPIIEIVPSNVQISLLKKTRLTISKLQKTIDLFQPDIIHTHLFEAEIVSRSCTFPKAKWFTHSHDRMKSLNNLNLFAIKSKRDLTNYFEKKYLLKRYQKNDGNNFIAISEDILHFLKSVLPKKFGNIQLLQNAIDVKRFEKPVDFISKKDNSVCNLISVGRLDKNKNHQFLIDVVLDLKNKNIPVHLTIVGEGDQRIALQEKIVHLNLSHQISLVGLQEKVEAYLWNADLYIHSAITEGFGLTLVEAMAAGLPVISLNGGGNKNLIHHAENGFIIEEQDVNLFSKFIIQLHQNTTSKELSSKHAKEFASNFDITTYIEQLTTIYKKAL